ncbi:protein JASON-like isoform X2 [Phragmites australis]|uniref:protein JASON-like isoform X2 n=1 Tax=Phragmites australis TaxID=29695 RepID=UPI002D77F2E0|nr:protein JASON-like isoform X2 [Phragmites australis]
MGCFLSCFRGAGRDQSGDLRDPLVRGSRLGEAFLDDEKKFEASRGLEEDAGNGGDVDEELRREANYLKSCGTISQTPPEILEVSSPISSEKAKECNGTSTNAQVMKEATLLEGNLSEVLNSDEHDILKREENMDEGTLIEPRSSLQDKPSCQNIRNQRTDSSDSPYPTPLILRGEIQTPGTVYTAYKGTSKSGKRARASRQFIYPVLKSIENKLQWMEARMDSPVLSSKPPKRRYLSADVSEQSQQTFASSKATHTKSLKSVSFPFHDNCAAQDEFISPQETKGQNGNQKPLEGGELLRQDSEYGQHGVSSLSHWLKLSSADGESHRDTDGNVGKEPCYEKSIFDVPIFPAFGFNWDNDNPTPVLPKAWDGNGIPNTTTKYKEDQKVSWHATPFEERLLKVLSDEKPQHGRNISGKLIHLEKDAE